MLFQESIPCVFSWRSQGPWIVDWIIGLFFCLNMTWLLSPKGGQRWSSHRFSGSLSNPGNFKATRIHSRWSYRSQHDFSGWCMTNVFWWCNKNRPCRQDHCRSQGGIYLTRESRSSLCILIDGIQLQQCSWVHCIAIGLQLLNKWGYNTLKLMMIPNWLSIKSKESMRSVMKTWYLITMQPLTWPTHLMVSTWAMCLVSKIQRQML